MFSRIVGFAVIHTTDLALLDWIYDHFQDEKARRISYKQCETLGEQGDVNIVQWVFSRRYTVNPIIVWCGERWYLKVVKFLHKSQTEGCRFETIFEADRRGQHHVMDFLLAFRPMKYPKPAIERAKREGCFSLAVKIEIEARAPRKLRHRLTPAFLRRMSSLDCDEGPIATNHSKWLSARPTLTISSTYLPFLCPTWISKSSKGDLESFPIAWLAAQGVQTRTKTQVIPDLASSFSSSCGSSLGSMKSNRVGFRVLTNRSLFTSIVAFSSGVSYFVFQIKEQLVTLDQSEIIELWQHAICSGDKCTLEAIKLLLEVEGLHRKLWKALVELMPFAVAHTKDLELLEWLYENFPDNYHREIHCEKRDAVGEQGDVEVAKWAMTHEYHVSTSGAAKFGHLALLQYLHEVGYADFSAKAMDEAATNGHLAVVEFLRANRQEGCTHKAMDGAAKNGHVEVLQYLGENRIEGCITGSAIKLATENGHTKCVKYLFEIDSDGFIPREDFVTIAASSGYLELIKYFHINEYFRFSPRTMHSAAIANHLHIVKFLHENRTEGCRVDTLFECEKRELHRVLEFLFANRPMKNPAKAIARAKREDRPLLAAKLERCATTADTTYLYR